jgi:hypothetical protein
MPYHSKGLGKNKEIKRLRNHPLPTLLMAHGPYNDGVQNEIRRIRDNERRDREDHNDSKDV